MNHPKQFDWNKLDTILLLLVAGAALVVYLRTLAPSVDAGDVAELQFISAQLGIPHPNGYPFYILLGWLWSWLPLDTLAWRMNLLSAVLGAAGVGLVFLLFRAAGLRRMSALAGGLAWAFQRTFWVYAGLAHRYTLLMLLGVALLLAMLLWRRRGQDRFLLGAGLLAGLGIASHIAAPLFFLPAAVLLAWPGRTRWPAPRTWGLTALLALLPLLLFAYIPLRGNALWNASTVSEVYATPQAVLHGLIHPRFAPDPAALWSYFTAGSPSSLGQVLTQAAGNTWFIPELVQQEVGSVWLALGLGGMLLALWRDRAWGVALWTLFIADLLLAFYYRQGNVEAYFLPAALVLVAGLAEMIDAARRLAARPGRSRWLATGIGLAALVVPLAFLLRNAEAANHRSDLAMDRYWRQVLALDLEQGAGLVAHWSDLTPLWYFQQAEELRPDLLGLYLPELAQIRASLRQGDAVYLAGPLGDWYGDLQREIRLVPWGPLVRLALPVEPAPAVEHFGVPIDTALADTVMLRTVTVPAEPSPAGTTIPVNLTWTSLAPVDRDLHISLRLREQGTLVAQQDDRVVSPWFALDKVEPGLDFWSQHSLRIPNGLQPGRYDLRAVVYELGGSELQPAGGGVEIDLGTAEVAAQVGTFPWRLLLPTISLAPCLTLESAASSTPTALIGSSVGVDLLWEARCQPAVDMALRFYIEDQVGRRSLDPQPLDAAYPPTQWQPGQRVLTHSRLRLPADLAPGEVNLSVEAVDPTSGQPLSRRWGPIPLPGRAHIATISLATRPHETAAPALANPADASFGGQIRLLGYEIADDAIVAGGPLTVTLAWQAEQAMDISYSIFLHLLDSEGRIIAQRDAPPGGQELPTSLWLPGEVVVHEYILQPDLHLQPGIYHLIVGIYEPVSWHRLMLTGTGEDHVRLHTIRAAVD